MAILSIDLSLFMKESFELQGFSVVCAILLINIAKLQFIQAENTLTMNCIEFFKGRTGQDEKAKGAVLHPVPVSPVFSYLTNTSLIFMMRTNCPFPGHNRGSPEP